MIQYSRTKLHLIWKVFLIPIFFVVLLHFIKDITQDILGINTILDVLGNINEDISRFPEWLLWFYHWAWINAFFINLLLILIIPKKFVEKNFSKLDKLIVVGLLYLISMTVIAFLLTLM